MRYIIQILYFLGSIPGLSFFNSLAANFGRLEGVSHRIAGAKHAASELKNKSKNKDKDKDNEDKTRESRW